MRVREAPAPKPKNFIILGACVDPADELPKQITTATNRERDPRVGLKWIERKDFWSSTVALRPVPKDIDTSGSMVLDRKTSIVVDLRDLEDGGSDAMECTIVFK
jgi:hypothetical protein